MSVRTNVLYSIIPDITPRFSEGGVAATLKARDYKEPQCVVLNDQGGGVMSVSDNMTGTIRASEHGHQPVVLENHPADSRLTISKDNIVQTLSSRMGTGGGAIRLCLWIMNR